MNFKLKKNKINKKKILRNFVFIGSFLLLPCVAFALEYTLLETLPGIGESTQGVVSFEDYLYGAFKLAIGLAIVLAIFQLSRGGFTYITTEAFTGKSDARNIITNAVIGLLIALLSYLLLSLINPDLVNTDLTIPSPQEINNP